MRAGGVLGHIEPLLLPEEAADEDDDACADEECTPLDDDWPNTELADDAAITDEDDDAITDEDASSDEVLPSDEAALELEETPLVAPIAELAVPMSDDTTLNAEDAWPAELDTCGADDDDEALEDAVSALDAEEAAAPDSDEDLVAGGTQRPSAEQWREGSQSLFCEQGAAGGAHPQSTIPVVTRAMARSRMRCVFHPESRAASFSASRERR